MSDNPYLIYFVMQTPMFLGILFAGALCLIRHRGNPRGAVFLGVAILLSLAAYIPSLILMFYPEWIVDLSSTGTNPQYAFYGISLVASLMQGLSWVMIGLAVFARAHHEDVAWDDFSNQT